MEPTAVLEPAAPPVAQPAEPTPPIKIRKKRAPKHDFKDGNGRVFAHKHDNGKGWVADTAKVDDSVYVGPRCGVFNNAIVKGLVRLEGCARISGSAVVSGGVFMNKESHIYGKAVVRDTTKLFDSSRVFGSAHVSGTSLLHDKSQICESAQAFSVTLRGEAKISGNAFVVRSQLLDLVEARGECSIIQSVVQGLVFIRDRAQIIRSNVRNYATNNNSTDLCDFVIVADGSTIAYPIALKDHAILVRTHLGHDYNAASPPPPIDGRTVLQHQTFRSAQELVNYMNLLRQSGGRLGAAQILPNGQVAPVAVRRFDFDQQPTGRRLMRLQEEST